MKTLTDISNCNNPETEVSSQFLGLLAGDSDIWVAAYDDKTKRLPAYGSLLKAKQVPAYVKKHNNNGVSVVFAVHKVSDKYRTTENITEIRGYFVDLDDVNELPDLDNLPFPLSQPTAIVKTAGGYHLYWLFNRPISIVGRGVDEIRQSYYNTTDSILKVFNGVLTEGEADIHCKDLPRVLRIPGSLNFNPDYGDEPYRTTVVDLQPTRMYDPDQFEDIVGAQSLQLPLLSQQVRDELEAINFKGRNKKTILGEAFKKIRRAKVGERNITLFEVSKDLFALMDGVIPDDNLHDELLAVWTMMHKNGDGTLDDWRKEGSRTITSAHRYVERNFYCFGITELKRDKHRLLYRFGENGLRFDIRRNRAEYLNDVGAWVPIREVFVTIPVLMEDIPNAPTTEVRLKPVLFDYLESHEYDPVVVYLDGLDPLQDMSIQSVYDEFDSIMSAALHIEDQETLKYLKVFFTGAVKRAYVPGCQFDLMLSLIGNQGIGKTRFVRTMFGEFYTSLDGTKNSLEESRQIQIAWGVEYNELETAFSKKANSQIKEFLTRTTDDYRPLYRDIVQRPRRCVFVSTSNERSLYNDPTGSRRFLTVELGAPIDFDILEQNRDYIWALSRRMYKDNYPTYLSYAESLVQQERNNEYKDESNISYIIDMRLPLLEQYTIQEDVQVGLMPIEITAVLLNTPMDKLQNVQTREVSKELAARGYVKKSKRVGDSRNPRKVMIKDPNKPVVGTNINLGVLAQTIAGGKVPHDGLAMNNPNEVW